MTERILMGPFLTRVEVARRAGISADEIRHRPDLMHVGGETYKEAYFAFQFDRKGIRDDVGRLVLALRGRIDDSTIADWLIRSNPVLDSVSPLSWLNRGGDAATLIAVTRDSNSPVLGDTAPPSVPGVDRSRLTPPLESVQTERTRRLRFRPAGSH